MSRRRLHRRAATAQPHRQPSGAIDEPREMVLREASYVERLAYTRSQAAQALGVSRSTFSRRVLPYVETLEMPWGGRLIPVDELERLLAERRRGAAAVRRAPAAPGRKPTVAPELVERIVAARTAGRSFRQIAMDLKADGTPTAHGGARWWPSTVRSVIERAAAQAGNRPGGTR